MELNENIETRSISHIQSNFLTLLFFGIVGSLLILFIYFNDMTTLSSFNLYVTEFFGSSNWSHNAKNPEFDTFYPNITNLLLALMILSIILLLKTNPLLPERKKNRVIQIFLSSLSFIFLLAYVFSKICSHYALNFASTAKISIFSNLTATFEIVAFTITCIFLFLSHYRNLFPQYFSSNKAPFYTILFSMFSFIGASVMKIVCLNFYYANDLDNFHYLTKYKPLYSVGAVLVQLGLLLFFISLCLILISKITETKNIILKRAAIVLSVVTILIHTLRVIFVLIYDLADDFPFEEWFFNLIHLNPILKYLSLLCFISLLFLFSIAKLKENAMTEGGSSSDVDKNETSNVQMKHYESHPKITSVVTSFMIVSCFTSLIFITLMLFRNHSLPSFYIVRMELVLSGTMLILLGIFLYVIIIKQKMNLALLLTNSLLLLYVGAVQITNFVYLYKDEFTSEDVNHELMFWLLYSSYLVLAAVMICTIFLVRNRKNSKIYTISSIIASIGLTANFVLPVIFYKMDIEVDIFDYSSIQRFAFLGNLFVVIPEVIIVSSFILLILLSNRKHTLSLVSSIVLAPLYIASRIAETYLQIYIPPVDVVSQLGYDYLLVRVNIVTHHPLINQIFFIFIVLVGGYNLIHSLFNSREIRK